MVASLHHCITGITRVKVCPEWCIVYVRHIVQALRDPYSVYSRSSAEFTLLLRWIVLRNACSNGSLAEPHLFSFVCPLLQYEPNWLSFESTFTQRSLKTLHFFSEFAIHTTFAYYRQSYCRSVFAQQFNKTQEFIGTMFWLNIIYFC